MDFLLYIKHISSNTHVECCHGKLSFLTRATADWTPPSPIEILNAPNGKKIPPKPLAGFSYLNQEDEIQYEDHE